MHGTHFCTHMFQASAHTIIVSSNRVRRTFLQRDANRSVSSFHFQHEHYMNTVALHSRGKMQVKCRMKLTWSNMIRWLIRSQYAMESVKNHVTSVSYNQLPKCCKKVTLVILNDVIRALNLFIASSTASEIWMIDRDVCDRFRQDFQFKMDIKWMSLFQQSPVVANFIHVISTIIAVSFNAIRHVALGCGHGHYENINATPLPKGWNSGMALTLIYNHTDVPLMRQRDRGI